MARSKAAPPADPAPEGMAGVPPGPAPAPPAPETDPVPEGPGPSAVRLRLLGAVLHSGAALPPGWVGWLEEEAAAALIAARVAEAVADDEN